MHYRNLIGKNLTLRGSLLSDPPLAQEMVNMVAEKGIYMIFTNVNNFDPELVLRD